MSSKILAAALFAALAGLVPSTVSADPSEAAAATPEHDNKPPSITDTPPPDFGPWTDSARRAPYQNLLGEEARSPLLDNGRGKSALSLSGYLWEDLGYMITKNEQPGLYDQDAAYMQGRLVLRAEYERTLVSDLFAAARVEVIGFENEYTKSQYEPHTHDIWLKVGQKGWDVQVGRFLPFVVYYRGLGVDLYTPEETGAQGALPPLYHVNYAWGLQDEPGQFALHLFPLNGLGIEVSGIYGQSGTSGLNTYAVRPVVDWKLGGLEVVVGGEYFRQVPQRSEFKVEKTQYGAGGRLQYTFWLLTAGAEAAWAHSEKININEEKDGAETYDRLTVGGWVDLYAWNDIVSVGAHYTVDDRLNRDQPTQLQGYVAYVRRLPVKGLSAKLVYGVARGVVDDATADVQLDNSMQSFRLRLEYLFQ
jgi:hypothetical protein